MAGSSRGGGGIPCPNRTIIIPQGTIDPDQNNVIHVPRNLDTSAPLLVTPPRREGGPLSVQLLPDFQDRLSQPREPSGERVGRLSTEPQQCTSEYAKRRKNQKREEHLRAVAVTWPPERPPEPEPEPQNIDPEEAKRICSGVGEQNIKSFRSLSRSQTRGGPVQTQAFSMEAPDGINQQAMDKIFWESNASGYDYSTMQDTLRASQTFQQGQSFPQNWSGAGFQPQFASTPERGAQNYMQNTSMPSPVWPNSMPGTPTPTDSSKCGCERRNGNDSSLYQTAQSSPQNGFFPRSPPAAQSTPIRSNLTYNLPDVSTMYQTAQNMSVTPPPGVPASCQGFLAATTPPPQKEPCNPECGGDCSAPSDPTPQPPDNCVQCFDLTQQSMMMSQQQDYGCPPCAEDSMPPPPPPPQEQCVCPPRGGPQLRQCGCPMEGEPEMPPPPPTQPPQKECGCPFGGEPAMPPPQDQCICPPPQQQNQCICPPPMPPPEEQYGCPPCDEAAMPPPEEQYGCPPCDEAAMPPPQEQYGCPPCDEANMPPPEQYGCPPCDEANMPPPEQYGCPPCDEANMPPPEQYGCPPCDEANMPPPEQYGCPPCDEANMPPPEQYGCPPCDEPEPEPCKPTCGGECNAPPPPPQEEECCPPCYESNQQQMMPPPPPPNVGGCDPCDPNCPQEFSMYMYDQGFPGMSMPPQQIQQTTSMPAPPRRMSGAQAMAPRASYGGGMPSQWPQMAYQPQPAPPRRPSLSTPQPRRASLQGANQRRPSVQGQGAGGGKKSGGCCGSSGKRPEGGCGGCC